MPAHGVVDLSVQIGPLRLSNPLIAASGTFGYGIEFAHLVNLDQLGAIVTKGLSLEPMEGAAAPRLCETPSGMLNAVGLQNIGARAFLREKLPALPRLSNPHHRECVWNFGCQLCRGHSNSRGMPKAWQPTSLTFPARIRRPEACSLGLTPS